MAALAMPPGAIFANRESRFVRELAGWWMRRYRVVFSTPDGSIFETVMTEAAEIQAEIMKHTNLRIYLAHGDDAERDVIMATLSLLTHSVELSTNSSADMLRRCAEDPPDLAIVGTGLTGEDIFTVADEVADLSTCPVIAYIRHEDIDRSHRLLRNEVTGVLVQPATELDWRPAVYLACRRWEQSDRLKHEVRQLEREIDAIDAGHLADGETDGQRC